MLVPMAGREARLVRLAQNEARARAENDSRSAWFHGHERVAFVCECSDEGCSELVSLDREAYTALRDSPIRFAVAPGHEMETVERVLERTDGYWIVEKLGIAAEVARQAADERAEP